MQNNYKGKVAVVTGAGGTLCSVIAKDLARKGAKVALLGRTESKLSVVAKEIERFGGIAITVSCDVNEKEQVINAKNIIMQKLGRVDFLINGAGGNNVNAMTTYSHFREEDLQDSRAEGERGFFDLDAKAFEKVLVTNTLGTVIPTQVFGIEMARQGKGAIINFASMNTYRPLTRVPAYAMAKAGVANLTQSLAVYFANANIRVNAIAPGFFVNERSKGYLGTPETGLTARGQNVINHTPMARFGDAAELLGAINFLLNDEQSGFVTGITIPVDGGFLAHSGV